MPSKKLLDISTKPHSLQVKFLADRNLGRYQVVDRLRKAGIDVTAHDTVYDQLERDPWIFYECGKKGIVVITADREFMKFFPHMAAIEVGRTKIVAFASNRHTGEAKGKAFLAAEKSIMRAIRKSKDKPFIGVVDISGKFRIQEENPRPSRKLCDPKDIASYERVCAAEGILFLVQDSKETA